MLRELSNVSVTDPFLVRWQRQMAETGVPHLWQQCRETGRLENFHRAARKESGTFVGRYFNDSDVHKVAEAAAYGFQLFGTPALKDILEEWVGLVTAAQMPDGYIDTYIQVNHPDLRYFSLASKHEMYCMGHLLEACCAYETAVGDGRMRAVAVKVADHLCQTFGPGKTKGYCGHQEVEIGLARAGRLFDRPEFVALAKWMTDTRGSRPSPFETELADPESREFSGGYPVLVEKEGVYEGAYFQDDLPLREQKNAVGHSVRAMYQFCGALDSMDSADGALLAALETIWGNMVDRRLYITGGIGSSGRNEGFTKDYDLPNLDAYCETCAAVGLCMWASRMAMATGKGKYADVFLMSLFNNVLAGASLDCCLYHYDNPLESRGEHHRVPWFDCACCPPNLARFLLSLGRYLVHLDGQDALVLTPIALEAHPLPGDTFEPFRVESEYPWRPATTIVTSGARGEVRIRTDAPLSGPAGDDEIAGVPVNGFAMIEPSCRPGPASVVPPSYAIEFASPHPELLDNAGRLALRLGPVVFCAEERDNGAPVHSFVIDPDVPVTVTRTNDLELPVFLSVAGHRRVPRSSSELYRRHVSDDFEPCDVRLRPYYSWNNGKPGTMLVWLHSLIKCD